MLMYADDTTLYCNVNQNITAQVINEELLKINQWLRANKLSLNVTKTKFMVFHMHNRSVSYPDLQINDSKIERVTEFNFLCLVLQSNLSWNKHINHISLKVSKAIVIIHRLKSVYPLSVLLTYIYFDKYNMISRRQTKRHSCVELSLPPVHKYKLMINQSIVIR